MVVATHASCTAASLNERGSPKGRWSVARLSRLFQNRVKEGFGGICHVLTDSCGRRALEPCLTLWLGPKKEQEDMVCFLFEFRSLGFLSAPQQSLGKVHLASAFLIDTADSRRGGVFWVGLELSDMSVLGPLWLFWSA